MHSKKDDRQNHEFMNATAPSVLPLLTQDCLRWCIWTCAPKTGEDNPAGLLESVMREKRDLEEAFGKLQDEKFFIERCLEDARRDTSRLRSHTHLHA